MEKLPKWCECTYCGIGANGVDHVIPLSYTSKTGRRNQRKNRAGNPSYRKDTVPACRECNSLLYNFSIFTIHDRADFIATRLLIRYERLINSPDWTEDELNELEGYLKSKVISEQAKKALVKKRIEWARAISYMDHLTTDIIWEAVDTQGTLLDYLGYQI